MKKVIEILPERLLLYLFFKSAIGRNYDPNVHVDVTLPPTCSKVRSCNKRSSFG